jgi:hypothetical protein
MSTVFQLSSMRRGTSAGRAPEYSLFPGGYDPDPETVLLLKMDEGEGQVAADYSGENNDAEIIGASWDTGRYGYGLYHDGVNDHLFIKHNPMLNLTGEFCIEAWVWMEFSFNQRIIEKPGSYDIRITQIPFIDIIRFDAGVWNTGIRQNVQTQWNYDLEEWTHVAFRRDADGFLSLVIDGVEDAVSSSTCDPPDAGDGDLFIGRGAGGYYFQGRMDEMRISNRFRELSELDPNT